MKTYDVLIVGCGPSGGALANYLRRYGHSVAIFDRELDVFYSPRATGLDDESIRIYQTLGIYDQLVKDKSVREGGLWIRDHKGNLLAAMDRNSLPADMLTRDNGHFKMNFFDQPSVERLLRADFERPGGADAYIGYEVETVEDKGARAELVAKDVKTGERHHFSAPYTVGCDGANSLVRRSMDVKIHDLGYNEDYLVIDAVVDDEVYWKTRIPDGGTIFVDPKHSGVMAKGVRGYVRFDVLRHKDVIGDTLETQEDFERAGRALIEAYGHDPKYFRVVRHAPYTFAAKMPRQWKKGRLLVAGDAAHQTPPWAGQGFNMGMRDASNLAMKLHLVLSGKASESIMETYELERKPDCLKKIKGAVSTGKLMQVKNPLQKALRRFSFFLMRNSESLRRSAFQSAQSKPPYRSQLIGKEHEIAGTLMPQPKVATHDGDPVRLDDLLGIAFALVTITSPTGPAVEKLMRDLGGTVLNLGPDFADPTGDLLAWFREHKVAAVLIRPDRYIFDAGKDPNALCQSLFDALDAPAAVRTDETVTPVIQPLKGHAMSIQTDQIKTYTNALNEGDVETALSVMADEFSLTDPFVDGLGPKVAVQEYYRTAFKDSDMSASFELTNIVESGDCVIAENITKIAGHTFKGCNVFQFQDGKLVALRAYANGMQALAADA
ncbi:MAG: bifunctional 3-(3-hydroxy-phenyl)propionate/3-hydroxycinnamic acid hydroxylase [Pseudomonadota bacterium]